MSPVGRKLHTPCHPSRTSCNTSFFDQSLDIVWDNNSPSPARTLSLGEVLLICFDINLFSEIVKNK